MPTPDDQTKTARESTVVPKAGASMPVEFIELGLALELLLDTHPVFSDAVKAAILPLDGEFLFELPHSGTADGKGRLAAIRLVYAGHDASRLVFVFLSDDADTRVEAADGQPEHLRNFATSFVDVIEKIGRH